MTGFIAWGGAASWAGHRRLVALAALALAWVGGPLVLPHDAACQLPAAEPAAAAIDPLTSGTLTAEQAARIVHDQEKKPRFPTSGGETEIQAALQAVGVPADGINQLLLHNNTFFHPKGDLGMYARQIKLNLADMASGELEVRRLLLSQHPAHGAIANKFADFLHLGLTAVPADVADALSEFKGTLCLPRLQRLESARLAKVLGRQKLVVLRCATSISDAAAAALAEGDAHIEAPLLMELDSEPLARKLSGRADLALPLLRTLGPRAAAGLAAGQGTIVLPEIRTLGPGVAQAIAGSRARFQFGLLNLTPAEAEILARGQVRLAAHIGIDSPGLLEKIVASGPSVSMSAPTLSEASARVLAKCTGVVVLPNVTTLSPEAADALAAMPADLHIQRLSSLTSVPLAEKLAGQRNGIGLRLPLKSLTAEIAAILARSEGQLTLDVETLDPEAAAALAARTGPLSLPRLTRLDSPVLAERLAAPVTSLAAVVSITPEAVAVLARGATESLQLGIPKPDDALLVSLSSYAGHLMLPAVESLEPAQLAIMEKAGCRSLMLGAKQLTPEVVPQVEKLPMELRLPLVRTLSEETIAALADSPLRVGLAGLDVKALPAGALERLVSNPRAEGTFYQALPRLTVAMAVGLAGRPGPVILANLESIDTPDAVAIATKLAAKQGPLAIPRLKRLSPKTLSALLDKVDIEIPRVTDLELIKEPDGSPTDDFVLPPGYEDRKTAPPARGR